MPNLAAPTKSRTPTTSNELLEDIETALVVITKSRKTATPERAPLLANVEESMRRRHHALLSGETLESLAEGGDNVAGLLLAYEREQMAAG